MRVSWSSPVVLELKVFVSARRTLFESVDLPGEGDRLVGMVAYSPFGSSVISFISRKDPGTGADICIFLMGPDSRSLCQVGLRSLREMIYPTPTNRTLVQHSAAMAAGLTVPGCWTISMMVKTVRVAAKTVRVPKRHNSNGENGRRRCNNGVDAVSLSYGVVESFENT